MESNLALSEQGTTQFPLQVQVEEDLEQEIESFVRLKRLGKYAQAHELFEEVLVPHITFFPVAAEYADLLLEEGRYRELSNFLDMQLDLMSTIFEEDEVELLRIMRSLAVIHTKGALRAALQQASKTWEFLQRHPLGERVNLPNDVQIHAFEIYIHIIVFAMNTSTWVRKTHMECPWRVLDMSSGHQPECGFIQWYQTLSENYDDWSASRVLIAVLKILPSLSPEDQKVAFSGFCFGTYRPYWSNSHVLPENEAITGFVASLSRAQALMDIALLLRLRYPEGLKHHEGFMDWYLSYIAALKYHSLASQFLSRIGDTGEVNLHRIKFEIQDTRLSNFLRSDFRPAHHETKSISTYMQMRIFPDWIYSFVISSDIHTYPSAAEIRDYKFDLSKLLKAQLHEKGDMIGYIESCALLHAPVPHATDTLPSVDNKGDDNERPRPIEAKFDTLVLQTMDVSIWLIGEDPIENFNRLIFEISTGIDPTWGTQDTAVEDSSLKEENRKPRSFDIPLYVHILHVLRGTSLGALEHQATHAGSLPTPISHIRIETVAGVIKDLFESEIESSDLAPRLPFLTDDILLPSGKVGFPLLSSMSGVMKIYQNARIELQSTHTKWLHREALDKTSSLLELQDLLDFAERDIAWRWHNHVFHCGFRCEQDDPIAGYQMKHILAMLEETVSNHLNPSAETNIGQDITAALSSIKLAHKFAKSILFDQRQRIAPALLLDNQSGSTDYRPHRISDLRKDQVVSKPWRLRSPPVSIIQNERPAIDDSRKKESNRSRRGHPGSPKIISIIERPPTSKTPRIGTREEYAVHADGLTSESAPSRGLDEDEVLVVEDFERHISTCMLCGYASRDCRGLCERGRIHALKLTRLFFSTNGICFSRIDDQSGLGKPERVNLPSSSTATLSLLFAFENDREVSLDGRENISNPYHTGQPWYPGGLDRGSRHRSSARYAHLRGADSFLSRDSGYGSRAGSAYSNEKSTYGSTYSSLSLVSRSKDKGRTIRPPAPQSEDYRDSRSRSTHRPTVHIPTASDPMQLPHPPLSPFPTHPASRRVRAHPPSDKEAGSSTPNPSPNLPKVSTLVSQFQGGQTNQPKDNKKAWTDKHDYEDAMPMFGDVDGDSDQTFSSNDSE